MKKKYVIVIGITGSLMLGYYNMLEKSRAYVKNLDPKDKNYKAYADVIDKRKKDSIKSMGVENVPTYEGEYEIKTRDCTRVTRYDYEIIARHNQELDSINHIHRLTSKEYEKMLKDFKWNYSEGEGRYSNTGYDDSMWSREKYLQSLASNQELADVWNKFAYHNSDTTEESRDTGYH